MAGNRGVRYPRAICPECKRNVAAVPPYGGDGSADVFRLHRTATGGICPESRQIVERSDYVKGV